MTTIAAEGRPAAGPAARRLPRPPLPVAVVAAVAAWLVAWLIETPLAHWIVFDALGMARGDHAAEALAFFLEDVPKVLLLLIGIVTIVTLIRSFFPPERVRPMLAGRGLLPGTFAAAGLGIVTPFCSCSAVPLFIGFVEAGVPLGVTFAFLISSPMVNEVALVLLWGLFGPGIALAYMAAGLTDRHRRRARDRPPQAGTLRRGLRLGAAAELPRRRSRSTSPGPIACRMPGPTRGRSCASCCRTCCSASASAP